MHEIREKTNKVLSEEVQKDLIDLEMKNTKFKVAINYDENKEFVLKDKFGFRCLFLHLFYYFLCRLTKYEECFFCIIYNRCK